MATDAKQCVSMAILTQLLSGRVFRTSADAAALKVRLEIGSSECVSSNEPKR